MRRPPGRPISDAPLRRWMRERDLTYGRMAEILEVPVRTIQEWGRGRRRPHGLYRERLALVLPDCPILRRKPR